MLSNFLRPQIRQNAVAALFDRRNVFIHDWTEACSSFCALRIIVQEQQDQKRSQRKQQNENIKKKQQEGREWLASQISMRNQIREASYRLHVPRTVETTKIGKREIWSPSFSPNLLSSRSQQQEKNNKRGRRDLELTNSKNLQQLPFTEDEFQRWISSQQGEQEEIVEADGYIPLPSFISNVQSLCEFKTQRYYKEQGQQQQEQVMGKYLDLSSSSSSSSSSSLSPFSRRSTFLHQTLSHEAEPYRKLLRWLSNHKHELEAEMCQTRGISDQIAKIFFRACLVHSGSCDAQFSLSLLRDLGIGDLLVSASRDELTVKQFIFSVKQCAARESLVRELSGRARIFHPSSSSSSTINSSSSSSFSSSSLCFPSIDEQARSPPRIPFSIRKGEKEKKDEGVMMMMEEETNEIDFNLCVWQSCVEPLLPNVLASKKDWQRMYGSSSSHTSNPHLLHPLLRSFVQKEEEREKGNQKEEEEQEKLVSILTSTAMKESLKDFDSELLSRMSGDVGGYVAVVVPVLLLASQQKNQQENENKEKRRREEENETSRFSEEAHENILLPSFTSGRFQQFPFLIGFQDFPLVRVWCEQQQTACLAATSLSSRCFEFDSNEILRVTFSSEQQVEDVEETTRVFERNKKSLDILATNPFQFDFLGAQQDKEQKDQECISSSSSSSPAASCTLEEMQEALFETLAELEIEHQEQQQQENQNNNSSFFLFPSLRLLLLRCPPNLGGIKNIDPFLQQQQQIDDEEDSKKKKNSKAFFELREQESRQEKFKRNKQQQQQVRSSSPSSVVHGDDDRDSLVVFENTFEYDQYLPRGGFQLFPHHWSSQVPTFSYLDEKYKSNRKAELERRKLRGEGPHPFSEILFPPHETKTEVLGGGGSPVDDARHHQRDQEELAAETEQEEKMVLQYTTPVSSSSSSSTSSTTEQEDELERELQEASAQDRNAVRVNFSHGFSAHDQNSTSSSSSSSMTNPSAIAAANAARKLREAQLRYGTVGAIFKGALKKKQIAKAGLQKHIARDVDRHLSDERFFNEKILPAGETALMMERELKKAGTMRNVEQIRKEKHSRTWRRGKQ